MARHDLPARRGGLGLYVALPVVTALVLALVYEPPRERVQVVARLADDWTAARRMRDPATSSLGSR